MSKLLLRSEGTARLASSGRPTRTTQQRTSGEPKGKPAQQTSRPVCLLGQGGSGGGRPGASSQQHLPWEQQQGSAG